MWASLLFHEPGIHVWERADKEKTPRSNFLFVLHFTPFPLHSYAPGPEVVAITAHHIIRWTVNAGYPTGKT